MPHIPTVDRVVHNLCPGDQLSTRLEFAAMNDVFPADVPSMDSPRVAVFRKEHFNAAHRLHNPNWSDEKNTRVYGKCNNPNYHGHNYDLIVQVTGPIDPETGYVMDMKVLGDLIKERVTDRFDHKNLNLDTAEFADLNPSAENIAIVIYHRLRSHLPEVLDLKIRLYETERNFVEYPA